MSRIMNAGGKDLQVPATLADRVVSWFSPERGLQRMRARMMASAITGYTAGEKLHRGMRLWSTSETSANEAISGGLKTMRARSRDLVRNAPIATGAINSVVLNVVGDGLVLQSVVDRDVLGLTPEQAREWQLAAQREFMLWSRRPDFTNRLNWDEMQALALRSVLESGDLFVARRRRNEAATPYGLRLQLIEAERVSNPEGKANTDTLVDGVVLDADGVPTGYSICNIYPGDWSYTKPRQWKTYDIGQTVTGTPLILHLYDQRRVDQARGVPYLAPVVSALKQLSDYTEAEIRAAVISAMFTVFVTKPAVDNGTEPPIIGSNDPDTGVDPESEIALGNGAIVDLATGEDVKFAEPTRPNVAAQVFIEAMCKQVGIALDLPFEVLMKSFTASYSAARASLEMAWQFFRQRRSWLAWKFCQPVYEWVITEAVVAGRLQAPGFFADPLIREAWLGSEWIGPSRIQLDPQKEAAADLMDLGMGTKTREQIIQERTGGSFAAKHDQLVIEEEARRAAGLSTPNSASAALQPPAATTEPVQP
jgi:lambda family phage portal protein